MATGAVKITKNDESNEPAFWCHYSKRGETTVYRKLVEDGCRRAFEEISITEYQVNKIAPLSYCKRLYPNQASYSIDEIEVWVEMLFRLENNEFAEEGEIAVDEGPDDASPIIVPVTVLRNLYDSTRAFHSAIRPPFARVASLNAKRAIADFYKDNVIELIRHWNRSHDTFLPYRNPVEWNVNARVGLPQCPNALNVITHTNMFASWVNEHGFAFEIQNQPVNWVFVEREISGRATRAGVLENGLPASSTGGGGVDFIFSAAGLPVVAELKVNADSDAFYALVQVLAYAVEFATPNQRVRLGNAYPVLQEEGNLDVAIILLNRAAANPDVTLPAVQSIVEQINERADECQGLGTITLLNRPAGANEWSVTR